MFGFMPAGVEADCGGCVACAAAELWPRYGFQKFPPVTSAISMLYEANRSSTVPMRGIFAGSSETACARTWSGTEARTSTTAIMAERNCTGTNLLSIRHLCGKERGRRNARFDARRQLTVGLVPYNALRSILMNCAWVWYAHHVSRLASRIDQHGHLLPVKAQELQRVHFGNSE